MLRSHPSRGSTVIARHQTPWPHIFLAGDWTATGWPATMEGAVKADTWQRRKFPGGRELIAIFYQPIYQAPVLCACSARQAS